MADASQQSIVSNFLSNLEFKRKKMGGVDEIDVLGKIEELAGLYEGAFEKARAEAAQAKKDKEAAVARAEAAERERDGLRERAEHAEADLARVRAELEEAKRERMRNLPSPADTVPRATAVPGPAPAFDAAADVRGLLLSIQEVKEGVSERAEREAAERLARARAEAEGIIDAARRREAESRYLAERVRASRQTVEEAAERLTEVARRLAAADLPDAVARPWPTPTERP